MPESLHKNLEKNNVVEKKTVIPGVSTEHLPVRSYNNTVVTNAR